MKKQQAKGWFLTYPKCDLTKEQLLEELQKTGKVSEWVVAQEKHKDGEPHLHAFIKYEKKVYFGATKWDVLGFHGNYQVAKSWKAVRAYCEKESDYISNMALESAKQKHSKGIMKEHLLMDPLDLIEQGILKPMSLANFVKNQQMFELLKKKRERPDLSLIPTDKKRHVWIYGGSNTGKTTKLKAMIEGIGSDNCFQMPYNNDWNGYQGERVLYCDEFKGQLTAQDLNRICDGNAKVNTKGGSVQLHPCPQVVVVSNYDIKSCFFKLGDNIIEALGNRFQEIESTREDIV